MLSFANICFLKVGNVDISFKLTSREFHSLIADGIHDFCEILVRLRGTDMFLLFSMGNPKFHLLKEESNLVCKKAPYHYLHYT